MAAEFYIYRIGNRVKDLRFDKFEARGTVIDETAIESIGSTITPEEAAHMSLDPLSRAIGSAAHVPGGRTNSGANLASANDQIRRDKQQLDDWTTCVSAKTTKGHAEIQRLSADLAGAQSRAHRLAASASDASSTSASRSIDVWA